MQIKTIMKHYLTTVRMTIFKTKQNNSNNNNKNQKISVHQDAKKWNPFTVFVEMDAKI